MATQATIQVTPRTGAGKGVARSLRRDGKIPGVIYGRNREAEPIVVDTGALTKLLAQISAATTIVDVAIEGRAPVKALIREIQRKDRKSTRLNSSHSQISYAVFCLKKKKKKK